MLIFAEVAKGKGDLVYFPARIPCFIPFLLHIIVHIIAYYCGTIL